MRDVLEELLDEDEEQDEEEQTALDRVGRAHWRARKPKTELEHALIEEETEERNIEQEVSGEKTVPEQGESPAHKENTEAEEPESGRTEKRDPVSMLSLSGWTVQGNTPLGRAVFRAVEEKEQTAREVRLETALGRVKRSGGVQSEIKREAQRRQVAEYLYQQMRRTQSAAEYRGATTRGGGTVLVKPGETVRAAVEAGQLDRAFERDARRYDGGFQWL